MRPLSMPDASHQPGSHIASSMRAVALTGQNEQADGYDTKKIAPGVLLESILAQFL